MNATSIDQTKCSQNIYEANPTQSNFEISATELQSKATEDAECDYDDDIEEGCVDDLLDNVSKISTPTSFSCYPSTSVGDSKLKTYCRDTDDSTPHNNPLRKRNIVKSTNTKSTKSKCVQFLTTSHHSTEYSSGESNELYSKPLKKIIFNGTFPIDAPYSSRFY